MTGTPGRSRNVTVMKHFQEPHFTPQPFGLLSYRFRRQAAARLCGTHISEAADLIFSVRSSMELSAPIKSGTIVGAYDLELWFSGSNFERTYQRNRKIHWHGTKGMCIDRKRGKIVALNFDLSQDIDLEFQGQMMKSYICVSGMEGFISMKQKGCQSRGCCHHIWPLSDLGLWTWPWIFKVKWVKSFLDWGAELYGTKGMLSQ